MSFSSDLRRSLMLGCALVAFASFAPTPAGAQQLPQEFSLPTPSPTPTPAPQGPADERAGVPIGPRVIRDEPSAAPAPTPSPSASATQAPTRTTPAATPPASRTAQPPTQSVGQGSGDQPSREEPAQTPAPAIQNENAQGAEIAVDQESGPGFETFEDEGDETARVGPDGWYDVDNSSQDTADAGVSTPAASNAATVPSWLGGNSLWLSGLLAVLLAALGAAGWFFWRRKQDAPLALAAPSTPLATGVRRTMGDAAASIDVAGPAAEDAPDAAALAQDDRTARLGPAQLDLGLTIISGSRSMMRFTIEFTLEVFNRSDFAVRDLNIAAKLVSARRGGDNAAPVAGAQPVGEIERIGPHQCRRITGTLQLPVDQITPISQGGKPVLIPLVHFTVHAAGQAPLTRSYVIGTPSSASAGRVHPLLLEGPPGGFPRLRAQAIRQPDTGTPVTPKSTEPA